MENSQLSKSREQGRSDIRNERGMKIFQSVTLVFLALFWIGFAVSYYRGIENNISTYGILIMTFSLLNQEVLFKGRGEGTESSAGYSGKSRRNPAMCLGSHYDRSVDFEIVEPGMVVCLYKIYLIQTIYKG